MTSPVENNRSKTIALVDSHRIMRDGLEYVLILLGYKIVIRADNGHEFMQLLESSPVPDICILDMDMRNMNGYQATRQLKMRYPELRILAYSTENHEMAIEKILHCGADAYLEKGVTDLQKLKCTIDQLHMAEQMS
jgi:DNA-binding NarL/FixJ family response regulator